ncbi:uncharacterized protein CC84DRAFT_1246923 [Paraphaeosphaeria sporulosa]|uniref:Uncharacterized protein n=1 Tax=Paraphaeosphaeria sporulosa TaxID=1460663 RepID=A0A177CCQ1_9PLEO|nr:uncharacterized protein CC84DRAFT_1246923 [Paraphaeosphaeria sporulosa]OAG04662.1 hypothetical protein CC84DRAFT_1246923 [Paraphaeosphaeria sporulosa]
MPYHAPLRTASSLLPVYTALRAAQVPSLTYLFSLDEQIAHTELEELYARIVLLWQEMRGHYVEFCCLCADWCVGEVLGFVREVGESAKVWCAGVGNEWEDLGWSMEEERLISATSEVAACEEMSFCRITCISSEPVGQHFHYTKCLATHNKVLLSYYSQPAATFRMRVCVFVLGIAGLFISLSRSTPIRVPLSDDEPDALEKRSGTDGLWTWQKPQPVIGRYPDGRLICRIVTMTAGHTQGPCPPEVAPEAVAKLLHAQHCRQHCCMEDGAPCGENWHVHEGSAYKDKHTYTNGHGATIHDDD